MLNMKNKKYYIILTSIILFIFGLRLLIRTEPYRRLYTSQAVHTIISLEEIRKALKIDRPFKVIFRYRSFSTDFMGDRVCRNICIVKEEDFYLDLYDDRSRCINSELVSDPLNGGFVVSEKSRKARLNIPNPKKQKYLDPENALPLTVLYPYFPKETEENLKNPKPLLW